MAASRISDDKKERVLKAVRMMLLLLILPLAGAETFYKSVGPDGQIMYSDRPAAGSRIEKTMEFTPGPSSPLPEYVLKFKRELERRLQTKAASAAPSGDALQLFTASWCGFCRKAKAYLAAKQIGFTEYDVETPEGMEALVRAGGGHGVPILVWRAQKLYGFSEPGYEAFLSARR